MSEEIDDRPEVDEWRTYDEFAAGIDTYRLPNVSLDGQSIELTLDDGSTIALDFGADTVTWQASGSIAATAGTRDPYDAVAVREDVLFVNLPLTSREAEAVTLVWSTKTGRAIVTHSAISPEAVEGETQVKQTFFAATLGGVEATGEVPAASRDLIGMRNVYRYSPNHLYEHVYMSSERYAWQNLQGVQRGHGDMDLSTVWKLDEGLYLFCFREFRISVASVWLHDLGYKLMTTGIFLGLNGEGVSEHQRAGGHIYPLGTVKYPDAQPV
ncbi:MAG: MoaF C-terminal domain-containing protein [Leucobacter sp.]